MSTLHLVMSSPPPPLTHHLQGRAANLPTVILENIFFRLVRYRCRTGWSHKEKELPTDLHYITQVCRSWRRVALDRNKLWSCIEVRPGFQSDQSLVVGVGLVGRYLSRSGPILPLDIHFFVGQAIYWSPSLKVPLWHRTLAAKTMFRFLFTIAPVRHRLRSLKISFMIDRPGMFARPLPGTWPWNLDDMPQLECLTAFYPSITQSSEVGIIDLSACSNRIRTCDITGSLKVILAEGLVLSSLTSLQFCLVSGCDTALVGSWYDVLRRMPALKLLRVTILEELDWDHRKYYIHSGPFVPIQLPCLEKLRVDVFNEVECQDREGPYKFLEGLLCPQLKSLSIVCEYDNVPPIERGELIAREALMPRGPVPFLLKNCATLEHLYIGEDMFYDRELARVLVRCTNLRLLHFESSRFTKNSVLLKELHLEHPNPSSLIVGRDVLSRPLCPNLEHIKVLSCLLPSTTTTTDVVDMIVSRREKGGSKLTKFEFDDCGLDGFDEDPRIKRICKELKWRYEDECA